MHSIKYVRAVIIYGLVAKVVKGGFFLKRIKFFDDQDRLIIFVVIAIHLSLAYLFCNNASRSQITPIPSSFFINLVSDGHVSPKPSERTVKSIDPGIPQIATSPQLVLGGSTYSTLSNSERSEQPEQQFHNRNIFSNPKPHYPLISRRMGQTGEVHLKLCINSDGKVRDVQLTKTSGHELLDQSALKAVSRWRFSAASSNNSFFECYRIPIRFTLEG